VLKWPDRETVDAAARRWAERQKALRPKLLRLGYFGSYARGDWGVGSDLDLIALVEHSDLPFHERPLAWDLTPLPVPADILVYTESEWQRLEREGGRFAATIRIEAVWL
jgi:predicted nucleotidyltransferase